MTERQIQNTIHREKGQQCAIMCPNYTPSGWWECDVWMVTKAGYAVEFEIKLSVADFKADTAKYRTRFIRKEGGQWHEGRDVTEKKHDLLAVKDGRCPSRFFYVVPDTLGITPEMLPEWAGLMTCAPSSYCNNHGRIVETGYFYLTEQKKAPTLHRNAVDPKILEHCRSVFYYRYWTLRLSMKGEILEEPEHDQPSPQPPSPIETVSISPNSSTS